MSVLDDENIVEERTLTTILQPLIDAKFNELKTEVFQEINLFKYNTQHIIDELYGRIKALEEEVLCKKVVIEQAPMMMSIREENRSSYEPKYQIASRIIERVDAPEYHGDTTVDVGVNYR